MGSKPASYWSSVKSSLRTRMVGGVLLMVPLVITLWILKLILGVTANILAPLVRLGLTFLRNFHPQALEFLDPVDHPNIESFLVGAMSIIILLVLIYFTGVLARYVLGRQVIDRIEGLLLRVPLVKSIYAATKQVVQAVSLPSRAAFKSVVLLEFPRAGMLAMGFATGPVRVGERELVKVFIPTAINCTTGFFQLVRAEELQETTLTVEEGFKILISGGILTPDSITLQTPGPKGP